MEGIGLHIGALLLYSTDPGCGNQNQLMRRRFFDLVSAAKSAACSDSKHRLKPDRVRSPPQFFSRQDADVDYLLEWSAAHGRFICLHDVRLLPRSDLVHGRLMIMRHIAIRAVRHNTLRRCGRIALRAACADATRQEIRADDKDCREYL